LATKIRNGFFPLKIMIMALAKKKIQFFDIENLAFFPTK